MKWRKKDYDTLRKQVNNYNNKIRRELKKGVSENLLPVKLSYKELKNTIDTREDFNNQLGFIKDFTNRYSMHEKKNNLNNTLPLWKIHQMERNFEIDRRKTKEEYKIVYEKLSKDKELLRSDKKRKQLIYLENSIKELSKKESFDWNNKDQMEIEMLQDKYLNVEKTLKGRLRTYRENYMSSLKKASTKEEYEEITT